MDEIKTGALRDESGAVSRANDHAAVAPRRARLRVVSRMTDPDGDVHETKNARTGTFARTSQGVVLDYDDVQEGERAHVTLTMREGWAQMCRRGMTSAVLTFVPAERCASKYVTVYGDIPVAVDTRRVALVRGENGGELALSYDVYVGGERTSSAELAVTWRL